MKPRTIALVDFAPGSSLAIAQGAASGGASGVGAGAGFGKGMGDQHSR